MSEENLPQDNLPEKESSSESPSIPELEEFIFKPDQYTGSIVPRELPPSDVAKFLVDKIDNKTELRAFVQVELVANFYDTNEIAAEFRKLVTTGEGGEDALRRSIIITRIIASIGKREDVEFATQHYKSFIPKASSAQEFGDLIVLHDVLKLGGNSSALRQRVKERIVELESKKDSSYEAKLEYLKFEETISNALARAEKAAEIKDKILSTSDRNKRIEEEIKAYLGIEIGFLEFIEGWSARRIRQETWAAQPSEQSERNDEQPLKKEISKSFRDFMGKLDGFSTLDDDEKKSAKIRILRAIKFFGEELSEEEESFLLPYQDTQADILSNEGFLLHDK